MRTIDPVVFMVLLKCAAITSNAFYDFHVRNIFRIAVDEGHLMSLLPINFVGSAVRQTACCGKRSARVIDGVRLLRTRAAHIVRQNFAFPSACTVAGYPLAGFQRNDCYFAFSSPLIGHFR